MSAPQSTERQAAPAAPRTWRALPAGIWALGLGSLFMDTSSELIHSLLPVCISYLRNQAAADAVVDEIVRAGGQVTAVAADVSVASDVVRLFEHTDKTLGPLAR